MIDVMLVDDHLMVMDGVQRVLEPLDIRVVSKIADSSAVIATYETVKPAVLVLDVLFGQSRSGLAVLESLMAKHPDAKVVVLSQSDHTETIALAFKLGAKSFVAKGSPIQELAIAIKEAAENKVYCPANIGAVLATSLNRPPDGFDARDKEILRLSSEGWTVEEIGAHFGHQKKWASQKLAELRERFGVERTAQMLKIAVRKGIIDDE